jgi:nucleoid-associated protein YgaU
VSGVNESFTKARLCEQQHPSKAVVFHFNPSTIKIGKKAEYREQPAQAAKKAARPAFLGAKAIDLQFSLLLDSGGQDGKTVMTEIQQLFDWLGPTDHSRRGSSPSPPVLMFNWGNFKVGRAGPFIGLLTSVDATCTLFTPTGAPTRAEVSLALREAPEPAKGTNPTSGGISARRAHQVIAGETLAAVAYATYGDAGCWRAVAEINGIDDPMRLPVGTRLLLPDRADLGGG